MKEILSGPSACLFMKKIKESAPAAAGTRKLWVICTSKFEMRDLIQADDPFSIY